MENDFPTRYDPSGEAELYRTWEDAGHFKPSEIARTGEVFSMVLPPPNATGTLHVGHAVMLAIEDMMVRYHRMRGDRTVWIPGTDHAAIATQHVVEKKLKKENVQGRRTRHELGREAFLREVEAFVAASQHRIIEQSKAMGASLDWSRLAYTLDAPRSLAVRTMFTNMYDAGVLYRGNRIVNWCPRCKSTLADDEVEYREEHTPFYYFHYGPVVIGTARPETKFQDKTLVVHPNDERYAHIVGTTFAVPWIEDEPLTANVIADPVIDRSFGTGAMTITPAHSFEDFELARQHGLPIVTIIDEDGNLTGAAGMFVGRNAREARADIVAILQRKGLVERIDEHYTHNLSVCYRCETPVEPLPKLQWFVDVNKQFRPRASSQTSVSPPSSSRASEASREISPSAADEISPLRSQTSSGRNDEELVSLKDLALEAVRSGAIEIIPERFTKEYFHWMENLRDWCISRQIWFGHRIPAWYHEPKCVPKHGHEGDVQQCKELVVSVEKPECEFCDAEYEQDPDTLDTWFSAGTWTFSTLGWPEQTEDLKTFHPTSVLETGYDILFFWVARMILMTEFALSTVPFKQVYLHGLVRDAKGRKMSKSLGNVIDPLDMTEKYGADAVRLALFIGTSPGADSKLDEQKIAGYAKFITKVWNIARYVAMQTSEVSSASSPSVISRSSEKSHTSHTIAADGEGVPGIADAWILTRRNTLIQDVTRFYEQHEYSKAAQEVYDFAWHVFADWYVEASKATRIQLATLTETLEVVLKLLHPAMPFVTETLWRRLGHDDMLIAAPWPEGDAERGAQDAEQAVTFELVRELVSAIRQFRSDAGIPPKDLVAVTLVPGSGEERARCAHAEVQELVRHFGRAAQVTIAEAQDGAPSATVRGTTVTVRAYVP
ncbi:MAG: valine--tRNA ligase [bacterium]|nr:valine--tRNA ligase [bacterium]